jgi:hypothetical protein
MSTGCSTRSAFPWSTAKYGLNSERGTFVVGQENVVNNARVVGMESSEVLLQQFYVDHSAI